MCTPYIFMNYTHSKTCKTRWREKTLKTTCTTIINIQQTNWTTTPLKLAFFLLLFKLYWLVFTPVAKFEQQTNIKRHMKKSHIHDHKQKAVNSWNSFFFLYIIFSWPTSSTYHSSLFFAFSLFPNTWTLTTTMNTSKGSTNRGSNCVCMQLLYSYHYGIFICQSMEHTKTFC